MFEFFFDCVVRQFVEELCQVFVDCVGCSQQFEVFVDVVGFWVVVVGVDVIVVLQGVVFVLVYDQGEFVVCF